MSTALAAAPATPAPRPHRAARILFAGAFVALPALAALGLAGLWAWSLRAEDHWRVWHTALRVDARDGSAVEAELTAQVEYARGVLGLTLERSRRRYGRKMAARAAQHPEYWSLGWHAFRVDGSSAPFSNCMAPPAPKLPFGRDGDELGIFRTCHASAVATGFVPDGGDNDDLEAREGGDLTAPIWLWMLPLAAPVLWWAWCPPGRFVPRLTVRRAQGGLAALALVLAALAAFGRASAADRALEALAGCGSWGYGPAPDGSGRRAVDRLTLWRGDAGPTDADLPAILGTLAHFPHVRSLTIGNRGLSPGAIAAILAAAPGVEELDLAGTAADDGSLAPLRAAGRLRVLALGGTRVADAGLAALAGHPTLEDLNLGHLPITAAGLARLHGLPRLRALTFYPSLHEADVGPPAPVAPDAALRDLARSLPALESIELPDGTTIDRDLRPTPGPAPEPEVAP